MPTTDKRIDAYIAKSADFAKPVLTRVRELVHDLCPDCEETLKWGHPTFMYRGEILCGMVAFKERCGLHFWKAGLIAPEGEKDPILTQLYSLTKVSDLPPKKVVSAYVQKAMELNERGAKVPRVPKPKKELVMPDVFMAAITKNKKALAAYEAFSPSHKREYIEWITDAKGDDTRARRIAQAVEWMAAGKSRNWKYM